MPIWRYVTESEEEPVVQDIVLDVEQQHHLNFGKEFLDRVEMPAFDRPVTLMTDCQGLRKILCFLKYLTGSGAEAPVLAMNMLLKNSVRHLPFGLASAGWAPLCGPGLRVTMRRGLESGSCRTSTWSRGPNMNH